MRQAVLDTDILSFIIDSRYPSVLATARQYIKVFRCFSFSSITATEVLTGMRRSQNHLGANNFLKMLEGCEVLPFDVEESVLTASIVADLIRAGQQIGRLDPFIAATAIQAERPLVTNNTKHYQRIIDMGYPLEIENWLDMAEQP